MISTELSIADQQHTWTPETDFKSSFPTRKGMYKREQGTLWRRCSWTSDWPVVDYRRLVTWAPPAIGMEPRHWVDRDYLAWDLLNDSARPPPTPPLIHKVVFCFLSIIQVDMEIIITLAIKLLTNSGVLFLPEPASRIKYSNLCTGT